jgi:Domain of unknown function (DUF3291)
MALISITRLRIRSWRYLPAFVIQSLRVTRQAASADGHLATALLRDRGNAFWTATSWSSEAAMKAFMHSGVHGPVMKKLLNWCDEAAVVRWTQDEAALPDWPEAHRRLQQEGRRSKVDHPTPAQVAFEIPPPVVRTARQPR